MNPITPKYTINEGYFGDGTIIHRNGKAMRAEEVLKELQTLSKDIVILISALDFKGNSSINVCNKHGGHGFTSDCAVCKSTNEIKKRCVAP